LGQGYSIYGEVIHGAALGHTIGIPTINQTVPDEKILPSYGVYAARCHVKNQIQYGVANLGCKPTVGTHNRIGLETHLFDFHQDIYGEMAEVELLEYIRPEQRFESVEALVQQMKCDIKHAKDTLNKIL
jgi:riboflavin kinase/FMN adenylyltransferase